MTHRTHVVWLALALVAVALSGCVYYNTFFNARQAFKEAEKQRLRANQEVAKGAAGQKYDEAMRKASSVLQNHPKSKYADDAILMIGKCFYYTGEYARAREKFIELTGVFRESPLVPEARFYIGMCEYQLDNPEKAESMLGEMVRSGKSKQLRDRAQFVLARIPFEEERYADALPLLRAYVKAHAGSERRLRADSMIVASYWEMGQYDSARAAYDRLARNTDLPELEYEALYRKAESSYENGDFAPGLKEFRTLARSDKYFQHRGILKYQEGVGLWALDSVDAALDIFHMIPGEYRNTEAAGRSLFALGEIYEQRGDSPAVAQSYFNQISKTWTRDAEFAAEAVQRSSQIGQRLSLLGQLGGVDSTRFAESHFLLGELYLRQLGAPDSALEEFRLVVDDYSESDYAPLAFLNMAEILREHEGDTLLARRVLRVLVDRYPGGEAAVWARRKLDLPPPSDISQSDVLLESGAETMLLERHDPDSALALYALLLRRFPHSRYVPKAHYARAWILDHYFPRSDSTVVFAYRYVVDNFPGTDYAEAALRQLSPASRTARDIASAVTDTVHTDTSYTDTAAVKTTIKEMADTTRQAPPPLEQGTYEYPPAPPGFLWRTPLTFVFLIHINDQGEVESDLELIGSSGYDVFDEQAKLTVLQTRFDPVKLDPFLTVTRAWYKYTLVIQPPAESDQFRDINQGFNPPFNDQ